jgi:hypothetical protein
VIYSFDLSEFEAGEFHAVKFPDGSAVSGDYVCWAESDEAALASAKDASANLWGAPETRRHDDFTVTFCEAKLTRVAGRFELWEEEGTGLTAQKETPSKAVL